MQRCASNFSIFALVLGLLCAFVPTPQAHADNVYASIRGIVTDPSGAAVAGALVTATNTDTGIQTKTISGSDGNFVFPQLQIGNYRVTATGMGFKTFQTSPFLLTVNEVYDLPIKFELGAASEKRRGHRFKLPSGDGEHPARDPGSREENCRPPTDQSKLDCA